jgi:hypothetical protein
MLFEESPRFVEPPPLSCGFQLRSKARPVQRDLLDYRRVETLAILRRPESAAAPRRLPDVERWLGQVYELCAAGEVDAALYLVMDELDELLYEHNAERCDKILATADIGQLPIEVMLGFLMGTFRARIALHCRAAFFARVERRLRAEVPHRADRLLRGLR